MGEKSQSAWLPLTPRGVAAFAHATNGRLLVVQFIVALLAAVVVGWFLHDECFPTVSGAIEQLPSGGEIRSSRLDWRGESPQMLAEGKFLALTVDADHTGGLRSSADVQVEFGRENFRIRSLLGMMEWRYPAGWVIEVNRDELKPRWGAWRPALLAGAVAGTAAALMLCWWLVAAVYGLPVWLAGFYANRDLNFTRSRRLAGAALMPGALLMTAGILFYGLGTMDLVALIFVFGVHCVAGWVYLVVGLFSVPRCSDVAAQRKNPFVASN
jgi:hypothetical protein